MMTHVTCSNCEQLCYRSDTKWYKDVVDGTNYYICNDCAIEDKNETEDNSEDQ